MPIVYIEKVSDFLFQLVKNGSENKSVAFILLFSIVWQVHLKSSVAEYLF